MATRPEPNDLAAGRQRPGRASLVRIRDCTLRTNPQYDLVPFDQLPAPVRRSCEKLTRNPQFFGLLMPRTRGGHGSIKSVCRNTARLIASLNEPRALPRELHDLIDEDSDHLLEKLILDGVLELQWNGEFISGPAAVQRLFVEIARPPVVAGKLAALSLRALQYAQIRVTQGAHQLSDWLYCYNRIPASPSWRRKLTDARAIAAFLGVGPGEETGRMLTAHWIPGEYDPPNDPWYVWLSRSRPKETSPGEPTYKLFVSPRPQEVRPVLQVVVDALTQLQADSFKVGRNVFNLLRSDKLVCYFSSFEEMRAAADVLAGRLHGYPAQGVPFTAELGCEGLLSWGIDPPFRDDRPAFLDNEPSWRRWVTNRLASALFAAKGQPDRTVEPWRFAFERLRLEGIDTEYWTPTDNLFKSVR